MGSPSRPSIDAITVTACYKEGVKISQENKKTEIPSHNSLCCHVDWGHVTFLQCVVQAWNVASREALLGLCALGLLLANPCSTGVAGP